MAIKCYSSLAFLVAATILLAASNTEALRRLGHRDLCEETDGNKLLCRLLLKGDPSPVSATTKSINQQISATNHAKALAARLRRGHSNNGLSSCIDAYDNAILDLQKAMAALNSRDKPTAQINLSSVLTSFQDCGDTFRQFGHKSPIDKENNALIDMARTALALVWQVPSRF